jgi:hypothetical protein
LGHEVVRRREGHPDHHAVFVPHHTAVTNVVVFDSEETV